MSEIRLGVVLSLVLLLSACARRNADVPPSAQEVEDLPQREDEQLAAEEVAATAEAQSGDAPSAPLLPWAEQTFSPRPGSSPEPDVFPLEQACGKGDVALHETASYLAELHATLDAVPDLDEVHFALLRRGAPYVRPRLWSLQSGDFDAERMALGVQTWARETTPLGELRCGVGVFQNADGEYFVSAVQVDVLAEVAPIVTFLPAPAQVDFKARFLSLPTAASVVLLPPTGRPFEVQSVLSGGLVEASLRLDRPGIWLVQLMGTDTGGPVPVARALVSVEAEPPQGPDRAPAPGEESFEPTENPSDSLFVLLNAARESAGLQPVRRNPRLDSVALAYARTLAASGRLSHDSGGGTVERRVERAGLSPKAVGENLARARDIVALHRVLWASPSHRENLLLRRWDQVGIAVAQDVRGKMVAVQLFADDD
jgi:uncharacterized protein YkwD